MKPFDAAPVLAAWPTLDPPSGFADRVLAAVDRVASPAAEAAPRRRWPIYAAVAAALVLLSPLVARPRQPPHVSAPAVAQGPDLDLGLGVSD
jgi:hypothetical protein